MKCLMCLNEKQKKYTARFTLEKAEKLLIDLRTRAIQKALQPAGDEIKHKGLSLLYPR